MNYLLLLCSLLFVSNTVFAQFDNNGFSEFKMEHLSTTTNPPKSIINAQDSVFVEVQNNQKYLIHTVRQGQTIYSIRKFYGVDFSDIYYSNPNLKVNDMKIGQELKIPIVNKAMTFFQPPNFQDSLFIPIYYKVQPKETLFRITRIHFRIPTDVIKSRNNLIADGLNKDQVIHIGWISKGGIPDSLKQYTGLTGVLGEQNQINKYRYEAKLAAGKKEINTDGTAFWDKSMNLSSKNKLYVMCSYVSPGGVVRLENTLTKRSLYAKVVAPNPENSQTQGTIVTLTPTVANALGGLDSRFYVKLYYCK